VSAVPDDVDEKPDDTPVEEQDVEEQDVEEQDVEQVEEEPVYVPPLPDGFVRAKHSETGHLAALGREALEMGMHPGWSEVPGPVPAGPKASVRRKRDPKTADSSSANKKEE
jgi:hypothetical protein